MCIGSHVCVYVRVRVYIYTCVNSGAEFMHVRMFSYACILTCVLMCVNAHIFVNLHSCVCVGSHACVCLCVCVCA